MLRRTFTLGRYNCVERLGSGPLGETWRAKLYGPAGLEGQFALERLHGHLTGDGAVAAAGAPPFLERLGAALDRHRALEHPGVPRLREVGQAGPQHYLVFELASGASLRRLRPALLAAVGARGGAGARLLSLVAAVVGRDLAEIVAHAHARGARATGLSPDTVRVDGAGSVRACALGLAEARLGGDLRAAPEVAPLLPYLAPEVQRGEVADARADVFAIAAVVLDLLTGSPPPEGALRPGGRLAPPADPPAQALWQALERALQPRPADRPAGAAALAALLGAVGPDAEARALLARLGASLGRREAEPAEATGADPLPPAPGERVMIASSADSAPRPLDLREPILIAPPAALQTLPMSASLAIAPRQFSGVVLAVEEDEHTVPVPHSPKSKIRVIEAEPPGSRVGLGASLRDPEPTPSGPRPREGAGAGAEVTAVPGMTSPGVDPLRGPGADLWSVPGATETDPGSGPSGLRLAAPPSRILPGRGAGGSSMDTPGAAALDLSDFDEPTALADYGAGGQMAGLVGRSARDATSGPADGPEDPSAPSWEMPAAPALPRSSLADQFPPLITDPVPLITPEEIEAELPYASAGRSPVPALPPRSAPPPPALVPPRVTSAPPRAVSAPPRLASATPVVSLPSLSKDDESFEDLLEEDEPTGSIPDAPARRLAEMMGEEEPAPSKDTGSRVPPAWAPPAEVPSSPLFPVSAALPVPSSPSPVTSAPPFVPAASLAPPTSATAPATIVTAPRPLVAAPPGAGSAPATRPAAARPAARSRVVSPAVAVSFALALVAGGSAPILYRVLRRPPRVAQPVTPTGADRGAAAVRPGPAERPPGKPAPGPGPDEGAPPKAAAGLALATTPAGAAVFVDGKPAGKTPASLPLGAGRHRLVVMLERHKLWQREVQGAAPIDVKLEPAALPAGVAGPGGLKVRCTTKGQLRIFVDGNDTGYNCPTERIALSPGPHKVEFFRPRTGDMVARPIVVKKGKASSTRLYTKF